MHTSSLHLFKANENITKWINNDAIVPPTELQISLQRKDFSFLWKEKKNLCFFLSKYQQHYRNSTAYQILFNVFPMTRTSFFFSFTRIWSACKFPLFYSTIKKKKLWGSWVLTLVTKVNPNGKLVSSFTTRKPLRKFCFKKS